MSSPHDTDLTNVESLASFAVPDRVELAQRESDGVSVALYWLRGTDAVAVTVDDEATGTRFELVVAENERALEVFYHPFAYASRRGLAPLGAGRRAGVALRR
jgi:hypothetical protein